MVPINMDRLSVDTLEDISGIDVADIAKLKQGGIRSMAKLDATSRRELNTIKVRPG